MEPELNLNISINNHELTDAEKLAVYDYVTCYLGIDEETKDFEELVTLAILKLGIK